LRRARGRRQAIEVLFSARLYADVIRESHEIIELILKGALRFIGVDPPKRHDVRGVLMRFLDRLPSEWRARRALTVVDRLLAMYGRLFPETVP
jgi:hypothetical protein